MTLTLSTLLPRRIRLPLAAALVALMPGSASAVPEMNTMKLQFGGFSVIGTYDRRSCAAQASMRSARGARVGFSIYWVPGSSLYLLTNHPAAGQVQANSQVNFRFPNGQAMAFAMQKNGRNLYTNIGFGNTAKSFYSRLERAGTLRIEIPALGDTVDVTLAKRRELEAAMRHCRDWLRS